jgi:hypothetical protein
MPFAVDEGGFTLPSLEPKSAFLVSANGPCIVSNNSHCEAVQTKCSEGVFLHEPNRFAAKSFIDMGRIIDADGKRCSAIPKNDTI